MTMAVKALDTPFYTVVITALSQPRCVSNHVLYIYLSSTTLFVQKLLTEGLVHKCSDDFHAYASTVYEWVRNVVQNESLVSYLKTTLV